MMPFSIYEHRGTYFMLKQKIEKILYDYQMIAIRDIETDHKIESILAGQTVTRDDIALIMMDTCGVGLDEYVTDYCGENVWFLRDLDTGNASINYRRLLKSLFISNSTYATHRIATRIFLDAKFIPYFVLVQLNSSDIKLLTCQRYGRARAKAIVSIKKEIEHLFNCHDVLDVIIEFLYPSFFDFRFPLNDV